MLIRWRAQRLHLLFSLIVGRKMGYCNQTMLVCTRPKKDRSTRSILEHYFEGFHLLATENLNEKAKKNKIKKKLANQEEFLHWRNRNYLSVS